LFSCAAPPAWHGALRDFGRGEVLLGIRPEEIGPQAASGEGPTVRGRVEVVERLGGQACLHLVATAEGTGRAGTGAGAGAGAERFAARVDAHGWAAGDPADLPISLAKAVFFDPVSGRSLAPPNRS
jgi:hypothetical protein